VDVGIVYLEKVEKCHIGYMCMCVCGGEGRGGHHITEEGLRRSAGRLAEGGCPRACVWRGGANLKEVRPHGSVGSARIRTGSGRWGTRRPKTPGSGPAPGRERAI
jgi:hypothetical protein